MKARKVIGNILVVLAVVFTVYIAVVMLRRISGVVLKDTYAKVFRYEMIACFVFILVALDIRFGFFTRLKPLGLRVLGWALRILVVAFAAVLLFLIGRITVGSFIRTAAPAENAIVLGLALENGKPADDLLYRLDTAEQYLRENPDSKLILTGGNADESGKTEAAVMREILLERGVADEKMVPEDRAETTKQNFRNTLEITDPGKPVVLISSNYHMDRAVREAESAGFTGILRLPAPSSFVYYGSNVMYEVILELNEMTLKEE